MKTFCYFWVARYKMTLPTFLKCLFLVSFFLCLVTTRSNGQKRNRIDDYPKVKEALNKKVWSSSKNYYTITKATNSTVHLFWGNNTLKRMFNEDLELWPAAERLFVKWSNKDYLILEYWTGSGVWTNLVLPMNKKDKVQAFNNGLCFDNIYNLLGIEQFRDTILLVENLKTEKKQYIVDKEHTCEGVSNNSCIDTISIKNKILYIKWVVPDNYNEKKKVYNKKVKLQL